MTPPSGPVDESIDEYQEFDGKQCILDHDFSLLRFQVAQSNCPFSDKTAAFEGHDLRL